MTAVYSEDFETGTGGWTSPGTTLTSDTAQHQSGTHGLKLSQINNTTALSPLFSVIPGDHLDLSMWYKQVTATSRNVEITFTWYGADGGMATPGGGAEYTGVTSFVWQQATLSGWVVPANAVQGRIYVGFNAAVTSDVMWIDNVVVTGTAVEQPPVPPSGQGSGGTYRAELLEMFTKADSTVLGPTYTWTQTGPNAAAAGVVHVKGNRVSTDPSATSPYRTRYRAEVDLTSADQWVQATIPNDSDNSARIFGVVGRMMQGTETGSRWDAGYVLRLNAANTRNPLLSLQRNQQYSSIATLVAGQTIGAVPPPWTIRLECVGRVLTAYVNDVQQFTYTDNDPEAVEGSTGTGTGSSVAGSLLKYRRAGIDLQDGADVLYLDNWQAGTFGQRSVTYTGNVPVFGVATRRVTALRSGALALAGAVLPSRTVPRVLTGAVVAVGTLLRFQRLQRVLTGSLRPAGAVVAIRTVLRVLAGSLRPAGAVLRLARAVRTGAATARGTALRTPKVIRTGSSRPAATTLPISLGRVFGRSGIVALTVYAAGQVRMRIRRPY